MNRCTKVRALRSCSGDVHVALLVVSLDVYALVGHAWSHCSGCCRRFRRSVSIAFFSVFGGLLFKPPVGDSKLRWLLPNCHCNSAPN